MRFDTFVEVPTVRTGIESTIKSLVHKFTIYEAYDLRSYKYGSKSNAEKKETTMKKTWLYLASTRQDNDQGSVIFCGEA